MELFAKCSIVLSHHTHIQKEREREKRIESHTRFLFFFCQLLNIVYLAVNVFWFVEKNWMFMRNPIHVHVLACECLIFPVYFSSSLLWLPLFFLFCYCCCCCCCSSFGVLPRHKLLCIQSSCYAVASMHLHFQLFSLILRLYKTFEFYIRDSMFLFSITCFCVGTHTHARTHNRKPYTGTECSQIL